MSRIVSEGFGESRKIMGKQARFVFCLSPGWFTSPNDNDKRAPPMCVSLVLRAACTNDTITDVGCQELIGTLPTDSVMQYQQLGGNWNHF